MAKVEKPIIRARFTDAAHKHAYVWLQGEAKPLMISELDHPDLWHEMKTSVAMTHFLPDAVATPPPQSVPATPASQAVAVVEPTQNNVVPFEMIARLEARIRDLEARQPGSVVDLDAIANQITNALEPKLAELRRSIPANQDGRFAKLEADVTELETVMSKLGVLLDLKTA